MPHKPVAGTMAQFCLFATGIIACYSTYAWLQEGLRKPQADGTKFSHTTLSLVIQCLVAVPVALILDAVISCVNRTALETDADALEREEAAKDDERPSLYTLAGMAAVAEVSFSYLAAMYCSNEALAYVPYPMQVLAKSCKMIPVLVGEVVVQGKRHPVYKWVCVVVMAAGVGLFQLSNMRPRKSKAPAATHDGMDETTVAVIGGALLLGSLVLDGYTGPRQKTIERAFRHTSLGFMAVQNLLAGLMAAAGLLVSGQLWEGVSYLASHAELVDDLLVFAVASALGQTFIFGMLFYFGPLNLTTVTTVRKFLSILLSVALNGHALGPVQWLAVLMVFGSIVYDKIVVPLQRAAAAADERHERVEGHIKAADESAKGARPVDEHPTTILSTPELLAKPFPGSDGGAADPSSDPDSDKPRMRRIVT